MRFPLRFLSLVFVVLLGLARPALADEVEVIPLKYRTAEQVIPVVRPLVGAGAAVTGMQGTLVVRGTRRDIDVVKQTLAAIDRMPRRLVISVRQDSGADVAASGASASGTVGTAGSRVDARVYSSRGASDERVSQTVQVLEGNAAVIMVGRSVPIREQSIQAPIYAPGTPGAPGTQGAPATIGRPGPGTSGGYPVYGGGGVSETIRYRDVSTGFTVVPRLSGDRVTLDINPQTQGAQVDPSITGVGGQPVPVFNSQSITTSVSGRLGEWIELGGMVQDDRRGERGILSSQQAARQDNRRVWVKVEELP